MRCLFGGARITARRSKRSDVQTNTLLQQKDSVCELSLLSAILYFICQHPPSTKAKRQQRCAGYPSHCHQQEDCRFRQKETVESDLQTVPGRSSQLQQCQLRYDDESAWPNTFVGPIASCIFAIYG